MSESRKTIIANHKTDNFKFLFFSSLKDIYISVIEYLNKNDPEIKIKSENTLKFLKFCDHDYLKKVFHKKNYMFSQLCQLLNIGTDIKLKLYWKNL